MTFLKKLGVAVLKITGVISGVLPIFSNVARAEGVSLPAADKLNAVLTAVITGEQMFAAAFGPDAKRGSDKLKAVAPFVAAIVKEADALVGKQPKDEAKFEAACTQLTSAAADLLNSYGD